VLHIIVERMWKQLRNDSADFFPLKNGKWPKLDKLIYYWFQNMDE
jgi:hypothetical protein